MSVLRTKVDISTALHDSHARYVHVNILKIELKILYIRLRCGMSSVLLRRHHLHTPSAFYSKVPLSAPS